MTKKRTTPQVEIKAKVIFDLKTLGEKSQLAWLKKLNSLLEEKPGNASWYTLYRDFSSLEASIPEDEKIILALPAKMQVQYFGSLSKDTKEYPTFEGQVSDFIALAKSLQGLYDYYARFTGAGVITSQVENPDAKKKRLAKLQAEIFQIVKPAEGEKSLEGENPKVEAEKPAE